MRLVLEFEQSYQGVTSWIVTIPFEYESLEKAREDFENAVKKSGVSFDFCGGEFEKCDFYQGPKYQEPMFYSLDEWFDFNRLKG